MKNLSYRIFGKIKRNNIKFFDIESPITYFILILSMLDSSCNKFIQIPPPQDQITSEKVFSNDQTATSALLGLYSNMMSSPLSMTNGGLSIYMGLSADEIYNSTPNSNADPFYQNAIPSNNSVIKTYFWSSAYQNIYQANSIIEGIQASTNIEDSLKNTITGEAKFIRAFYYFYLTNLFGDIPLIIHTDFRINDTVSRTNTTLIYRQIVSDLKEAQGLLPEDYPTIEKVRVNKWAVAAFLARVYLYTKDWAGAEAEADSVINSGMYYLEPDLNKVFLKNSSGTIWQLQPVIFNYNTAEGMQFIPSSNTRVPNYSVTNYLLDAFDEGDLRKDYWLGNDTVDGKIYYYPYKYKVKSGSPLTEYNIVLRLAEQYLIRAEAEAKLNELGNAINDLNIIRRRASLPDTTLDNESSILNAILHERQVELFGEWGNRWLDLKRTENMDAVLGAEKSGWTATDSLLPIPQTSIQLNPHLVQNPGY